MVRFSVLIPVYNGDNFIAEALQSVENQTLKDVQVIVSDNASTDTTAKILDEWRHRLNLKVILQPETLPMQRHFNAILDAIDTEFYMLLCHDDYLADPNALMMAQSALMETPDAAAVYCDLLYVNERRRKLSQRVFKRNTLFSANDTGLKTIKTARNQFGIPIGARQACLGNLRYDPQFHYAMDVDMSWSISRDQMALHIPKPLIANRYSDTNTTWTLLPRAQEEFIKLAQKYDVPMGRVDRAALVWTSFIINQQKRLFGLYGKFISWIG